MSALYTATIAALVVPLLGSIASKIRNPTKVSLRESFEDKPVWTTWIENVVQAFAARRPEEEPRSNRPDEPSDPEAAHAKESGPPQLQPPMQMQMQPQPGYPFDPYQTGTSDLAARRLLTEQAIQQATSRQAPQYPTDDIGALLRTFFQREHPPFQREYPSFQREYPPFPREIMLNPPHQPTGPAYLEDPGLLKDPWNGSSRNGSQSAEPDPGLTTRRRDPQANETRPRQPYDAPSPTRPREQAYDAPAPTRMIPASEEDLNTFRGRGLKPDDQVHATRSIPQDYSDQRPPSRGGDASRNGGGQAGGYLKGDFHRKGRGKEADRRGLSPDRGRDREEQRSRRDEAYARGSSEVSPGARYSDGRQRRDNGRGDRPYYDKRGGGSPTRRRDRERSNRSRSTTHDDEYYGGYYHEDDDHKERKRRDKRSAALHAESPEGRHDGRHRPRRSFEDDGKPGNSNHTNVVVNVGGMASTNVALPAAELPRPATPVTAEKSPIALEAASPVEQGHDIDVLNGGKHERNEAVRKRQEIATRYQEAMRGPPKRNEVPSPSQHLDIETAKNDQATVAAAVTAERENSIEPDIARSRTDAFSYPLKEGQHSDEHDSVDSAGLSDQRRQSSSELRSTDALREPSLASQPLESATEPVQSPRMTPLRGSGAKRRALAPIETATTTEMRKTADESSAEHTSVVEHNSTQPGHSDDRRPPQTRETSPVISTTAAKQDTRTLNHPSPLHQYQEPGSASPGTTERHNMRRSSASSDEARLHKEKRDMVLAVGSRSQSPAHRTRSPHPAATETPQTEHYSDNDTENPRISEPGRTVADEATPTKPRPPRHRRRIAREVLDQSSTLRSHNVRGPKSLARLIKLALKSSPKVTFLMAVVWVGYISGIIYFGNQVTALEQLTSASLQLVRRGPEDEIANPSTFNLLESYEKDTQLLIILNLWHAGIWLILLFLIDYIWRSIPKPDQDRRHQLWFDRLGFKSLARVLLTFVPMTVYLFLGARQLTSCAYLLNDPQAIAWSMWPDVALTWPQLSEAAITRATPAGVETNDVDGLQLLAVSAFFWGTGIPTFLYTIRRIRYPGVRSRRRLIIKIRKDLTETQV